MTISVQESCYRCGATATVECRLCDRDLCEGCADIDADLRGDHYVSIIQCDGGCRPDVVAQGCRRCGGYGVLDPAAPGCAPRDCPECSGSGETAWELVRGGYLLGTLHHPDFDRACAEDLAERIESLEDAAAVAAIEHFTQHGDLATPQTLETR